MLPPSMDRSAIRRSDTSFMISWRRAPADPVLIDTPSGGGPRQAVPGPPSDRQSPGGTR
jgi:hypothetical protein